MKHGEVKSGEFMPDNKWKQEAKVEVAAAAQLWFTK